MKKAAFAGRPGEVRLERILLLARPTQVARGIIALLRETGGGGKPNGPRGPGRPLRRGITHPFHGLTRWGAGYDFDCVD